MGLVVAQNVSQDNILYLEQQNVVVAQLDFIQVNLHQIVKNVAKDHILQQDLQNVPYVKQVHIHHLMELLLVLYVHLVLILMQIILYV